MYSAHGVCLGPVLGGEPAQHALEDGQGGLGAGERVEVLRGGGPLVGTGVAVDRDLLEALEVVVPAHRVVTGLLLGEAGVLERHAGAALGRLDGQGDRGGVERQAVVALPAPAEHDPLARLDLAEGASGDVARGDRPAVLTAGAQVDARRDRLPAAQALGLGEQGEGLLGGDGEHGALGVGHRSSPCRAGGSRRSLSAWASATSRSSSLGPEPVDLGLQPAQPLGGHAVDALSADLLARSPGRPTPAPAGAGRWPTGSPGTPPRSPRRSGAGAPAAAGCVAAWARRLLRERRSRAIR